MSIKKVIIHQVRRDKDGALLQIKCRKKENDIAGLTEQLAEKLIELFPNNLSFGVFGQHGDNTSKPAFEQELHKYYDLNSFECSNFVQMTTDMANRYATLLERGNRGNVKGGYLVFYQYEKRDCNWLAVVVLQKKPGIDLSDDLTTVAREILDLDSLHLGATINLELWDSKDSDKYIRFITKLASDVREYFEEFIGCVRDKTATAAETQALKRAIEDYSSNTLKLDDEDKLNRTTKAHQFISEKLKKNEPVVLEEVANFVFPESPQPFIVHASDEYDINSELSINKTTLRSFVRLHGQYKGISISFDRHHLGKSIIWNNGVLEIHEIPPSLEHEIIIEDTLKSLRDNPEMSDEDKFKLIESAVKKGVSPSELDIFYGTSNSMLLEKFIEPEMLENIEDGQNNSTNLLEDLR
ncbi:nucleoid-associated protein [Alteromonas sp. a30]|uniref:nucleoid-associated protein n=1 Tax=Alteromonas sp. a30 TaxID=2730917 RepID=UPI0022809EA0|nr:nucleoid-associated protein [Alteromonas sp. a30]MCY7295814.1 nucleoid-associated protein [Alteromonas sp. a30]